MTKRINYNETASATASDAKSIIDTLQTEKSGGRITDFSVSYAADVGAIDVHVWKDVAAVSDLPAGYDDVGTALGNLPVSLPSASAAAPVHNR